ncbi:uncharacterized protein RHOBADRAFT_42776 [Rhodotorula graminis WP1]|uniref:RRM domain-containing protein n=1 Tax=Rhodotorula graminis (strain WP1) TaxID=578459 RepID=A0A194S7C2_RHOGW|nr:uncharacterized protein RHOBADRAFT_42776 [Rhodotorula graminis WP1]KPV76444.1 hypothetical protein RHOBADRAFT_42776 [Rhodotorula graminis WP1]
MAKSTPSRTKATPTKPTTPIAAPHSASKPVSASQKRVRVVDDHAAAAPSASTPSSKKKGTPSKGSKKKDDDEPVEVGGNGVERKDLREKRPDEVEAIRSKDAPAPPKGALKKGKGKKVEHEEQDEEIKLAGDDDEEEEDEEADIDFLAGFESGEDDGEDSSDEEADGEDAADAKPVKADQLPQVKGAPVQKKLEAKEKKQHKTGTVYLGRIPKGFYEDEMRSYFSQFGEVTRLRLSRNKQTGASKHYAFIEFKYASVAQIVHETMDNYLLAGHILVCKVVPDDEIHPKLWVGANRKFRVVPKARKDAARRNAPKSDQQQDKIKQRLLKTDDKKRKQLADLGIEYEFAGYAGNKVAGADDGDKPTPSKKVKVAPAAAKKEAPAADETPRRRSTRKSVGGTPSTATESATKRKSK